MTLSQLPPGMREMVYGDALLTPTERADLLSGSPVVCVRKDDDHAAGYWARKGLPPSLLRQCSMCGAAISVRPWADIASVKLCMPCASQANMTDGELA